ncbi:glycosyltransferase family 4 protein [Phreatobacter sp.]|uniref:glycosyltransferase family 4 protein n=1 Tax=Phreatobacter sp. TaxID=1966341 RepID=UPI0022C912D8|nr:glycosyltransferase family 4 protein [Phreatobacter sp.]MCZ8316880.1 glycosyltransferase family 4 protein [Phreatobacter sp.]
MGRPPRVLHVGNIGNYAWVNAKLMRARGVDCVILDPDFYHVASAPEWLEAEISGDPGDLFYPDWRAAGARGFSRPEWFINGPGPFVLRELAAREAGRKVARARYAVLSALYRRGLASAKGRRSRFRALMESDGQALRLAKAMARRLALGGAASRMAPAIHSEAFPSEPEMLPSSVPREIIGKALAGFDVVLGYALGARFAHGVNHPRYASLELGTLRGLPFEDTPLGVLAAGLYRQSPGVFVTNVDCLAAAARLGIPEERITAIPHPFELSAALAAATAHPVATEGRPLLLCPARHHWTKGNASWRKGNDVLIRGAALAAERGADFRLVFVEWGEDVNASRELIAELGLSGRTRWVPTLPRRRLWALMLEATCVLDQFDASAFGGLALEGMALGRRVVTRLDQAPPAAFFSMTPPLLAAATPEELAARILQILRDPGDAEGIGRRGMEWMEREHGEDRQLALQFAAFERLLAASGASS